MSRDQYDHHENNQPLPVAENPGYFSKLRRRANPSLQSPTGLAQQSRKAHGGTQGNGGIPGPETSSCDVVSQDRSTSSRSSIKKPSKLNHDGPPVVENKSTIPLDPNAYKGYSGMIDLQMRRDDLMEELENTKQDLEKEQHLVREYKKHFELNMTSNEMMQESATKMVEFMESKELFLGEQATDDDIISRYRYLGHMVKNWTKPVTTNTIFRATELEEKQLSKIMITILPSIDTKGGIQKLLEDKAQRRQVARAWVHLILYNEILGIQPSLGGETRASAIIDLWMGEPVASAVRTLKDVLARDKAVFSDRELNDWRAYGVTLLSRTGVAAEAKTSDWYHDRVEAIQHQVMTLIAHWLPEDKLDAAIDGLPALIHAATSFSQLIRRQRASWRLSYPGNPPINSISATEVIDTSIRQQRELMFDPNTMEDPDYEDDAEEANGRQESLTGRSVQIMMIPGLFKRGNAAGNQYNIESCFAKAQVFCQRDSGTKELHSI